jgi:predicted nucleic acid-binding protein
MFKALSNEGMTDRYWDSNCFLGVLNKEADKLAACNAVIREANARNVRIITSALTIAEVLWPKDLPLQLPPERAADVQAFFQHEWIVVRDLDRTVAEKAREVVWNYKVRPKDACHVATAIDAGVEQFDTYDGGLIGLSGQIGNPALIIGYPNVAESLLDQPGVDDPDK